ncbi:hypothetical protein LCGC14_1520050, partial [marine sediment metagenome]
MSDRMLDELPIALTPGRTFRQHQIMSFQAPTSDFLVLARQLRGHSHRNQSRFPCGGCFGSLRPNSVSVVAVCRVELRSVTQGTINLDRPLRMVARIDISLLGEQQRLRSVGKLSKDRLTADYDDLVLDNIGSGTYDVFEIAAFHGVGLADSFEYPLTLGLTENTSERRILAQVSRHLIVRANKRCDFRLGLGEDSLPPGRVAGINTALNAPPPKTPTRLSHDLVIKAQGNRAMVGEAEQLSPT